MDFNSTQDSVKLFRDPPETWKNCLRRVRTEK